MPGFVAAADVVVVVVVVVAVAVVVVVVVVAVVKESAIYGEHRLSVLLHEVWMAEKREQGCKMLPPIVLLKVIVGPRLIDPAEKEWHVQLAILKDQIRPLRPIVVVHKAKHSMISRQLCLMPARLLVR